VTHFDLTNFVKNIIFIKTKKQKRTKMKDKHKIFRMDDSGEWEKVTWRSGDLKEMQKDEKKCQNKKDT
jgi:hypothetical protein